MGIYTLPDLVRRGRAIDPSKPVRLNVACEYTSAASPRNSLGLARVSIVTSSSSYLPLTSRHGRRNLVSPPPPPLSPQPLRVNEKIIRIHPRIQASSILA